MALTNLLGSPGLALGRRAAGLAWLALWLVVLGTVHAPWLHLGGLVPEWVRYWERVVLGLAAVAGAFVGSCAREAARPGNGWSHARLARPALLAPAAAVALLLLVLRRTGPDWVGVVFVGLLAYWAGFDAGIGAWPLLLGRHHSLTGAIEPDAADESAGRTVGDPNFR